MEDVTRAAAIACDPDGPASGRVDALVAIIEAVAVGDAALPDSLVEVVDDLALVDAALARRHASAVCALLHYLGMRPDLVSSRRRLVRRMIAAGVTGIALAGLAIEIGDAGPAVALIAQDFELEIAPRVATGSDAVVAAWLAWLADHDDTVITKVLVMLVGRQAPVAAAVDGLTIPAVADRLRPLLARTVPA